MLSPQCKSTLIGFFTKKKSRNIFPYEDIYLCENIEDVADWWDSLSLEDKFIFLFKEEEANKYLLDTKYKSYWPTIDKNSFVKCSFKKISNKDSSFVVEPAYSSIFIYNTTYYCQIDGFNRKEILAMTNSFDDDFFYIKDLICHLQLLLDDKDFLNYVIDCLNVSYT